MQIRFLKVALLFVVPVAFYLLLRSQASWRPRVLPHHSLVYDVAFSADGSRLTTVQKNGTLLEWDVSRKRITHTTSLPHYYKTPQSWQKFSPDGSTLAVCSEDCAVRLWNVASGKFLHTFSQSRSEKIPPAVAFSSDSKTLATMGWLSPVKFWDVKSGQQKSNFANFKASRLAFSPDGQFFASTRNDKTVRLWNFSTGKLFKVLAHKRTVNDIVYSPDGRYLAVGSEADGGAQVGEVMLWDTQNWQLKSTLRGHKDFGPMIMLTFSPNSQIVVATACSGSKNVKVWNVARGKLLREIAAKDFSIKFSPDGSMLVTGSGDGKIKLWRIK